MKEKKEIIIDEETVQENLKRGIEQNKLEAVDNKITLSEKSIEIPAHSTDDSVPSDIKLSTL